MIECSWRRLEYNLGIMPLLFIYIYDTWELWKWMKCTISWIHNLEPNYEIVVFNWATSCETQQLAVKLFDLMKLHEELLLALKAIV